MPENFYVLCLVKKVIYGTMWKVALSGYTTILHRLRVYVMANADLGMPIYEAEQFLVAGFSATVPCQVNLGEGLVVECTESLRILPKKRHVFKAITNDGAVIIKLIGGKKRATSQIESEARGLRLLETIDVPSPKVKQVLISEKGDFGLILLEYLEHARSFMEVWLDDLNDEMRNSLLNELIDLMSRLHQHGVMQSDIHLDNFMVKGNVIYVIDGATLTMVNDSKNGLAVKQSLDNLAVLFAQFYTRYDDLFPGAFERYKQRRIDLGAISWSDMVALYTSQRQKRFDRYQKKIFRSSTAHYCHRDSKVFIVCDRYFYSENMQLFLENPDKYIEQAEKLKEGNSATVVRLTIDGKDFVVKRYNIKSPWHWLKRQFTVSRAATSWKAAHLFSMIGLLTPRPIAMIQKKFFLFKFESYYISEVVPSEFTACDELIANGLSLSDGKALFSQVFSSLRQAHMSHGDLKATNFFVSDQQVMIIDLDAVARHPNIGTTNKALLKDEQRFSKNW